MDFDFVPIMRTPYTDLGGCLTSHQQFGRCAKAELKAMSCLEAYGVYKGKEQCQQLINDYQECFKMHKQIKRSKYMRYERHRQYYAGERDKIWGEDPKSTSF